MLRSSAHAQRCSVWVASCLFHWNTSSFPALRGSQLSFSLLLLFYFLLFSFPPPLCFFPLPHFTFFHSLQALPLSFLFSPLSLISDHLPAPFLKVIIFFISFSLPFSLPALETWREEGGKIPCLTKGKTPHAPPPPPESRESQPDEPQMRKRKRWNCTF